MLGTSRKRKAAEGENGPSKIVRSKESKAFISCAKINSEDIHANYSDDTDHEIDELLGESPSESNGKFNMFIKDCIAKEIETVKNRIESEIYLLRQNHKNIVIEKGMLKLDLNIERRKSEDMEKVKRELEERVGDALIKVKNQINDFRNEIDDKSMEIHALKIKERFQKIDMESLEAQMKQSTKTLVEKDEGIEKLTNENSHLHETMRAQNIEMNNLKEKIEALEMQNKMYNKHLIAKEEEFGKIESENHQSKTCINTLQLDLEQKVRDLEEANITIERSHTDYNQSMEQNVYKIQHHQNGLDTLNCKINNLKLKEEQLKTELENKDAKLKEKEVKLKCVLFNRRRVDAELKEKEKLLEDANSELEALKCSPLTVNYVSKSETETKMDMENQKLIGQVLNKSIEIENLNSQIGKLSVLKELGDKTSELNKSKTDVSDLKTKLREKVEACYNHSKTLQKYDSDMKQIELEANTNEAKIILKYKKKITCLKIEIQLLGAKASLEDMETVRSSAESNKDKKIEHIPKLSSTQLIVETNCVKSDSLDFIALTKNTNIPNGTLSKKSEEKSKELNIVSADPKSSNKTAQNKKLQKPPTQLSRALTPRTLYATSQPNFNLYSNNFSNRSSFQNQFNRNSSDPFEYPNFPQSQSNFPHLSPLNPVRSYLNTPYQFNNPPNHLPNYLPWS